MNSGHPTSTQHLYRMIQAHAREKRIFIDFHDCTVTYQELLDHLLKLSFFFQSQGIKEGSRILLITSHDNHAIQIFIAALLGNFTPIVLASDSKSDRVKAVIKKVSPACIFIDSELKDTWTWLGAYPCIPISEKKQKRNGFFRKFFKKSNNLQNHYPELLQDCGSEEPSCSAQKNDIAFISFSSGTTSAPKGILITHENIFEHLKTITTAFSYNSTNRICNNLPLAHNDGLVQGPLLALYSGALLFRPPAFSIPTMEVLFNSIYKNHITHFITVPTILSLADRLLTHNDYFSGEEFSYIVSVAAKLDQALWQRLENRFKIRICNMYGLTETVAGGVFCGPDNSTYAIGTIGKPIDMEARIVGPDKIDCMPGEEGELWLKGKNVVPGYLDDPHATNSLFAGDWLRTGDIARMRPNGCIEIVGRKKAIIISGGLNIYPEEVTEILLLHPDVNDAVTVGIPDKDWGELVVCAVESDRQVNESELVNHCRTYLEKNKVPKRIIQFEKLPRGLSEKVKLQEVKQLIENDLAHSKNTSSKIDIAEVIALASEVFNTPQKHLGPDLSPDETPGWDSLGHLKLITAAEQKFHIQFAIDEMMRVDSLRRLHDILTEKL